MKTKLYLFAGIVVLIALVGYKLFLEFHLGTQVAQMSILTLNLKLDRYSYLRDQAIQATLVLTNTGDQRIVVNSRMAINFSSAPHLVKEVYFTITDPFKNASPFKARVNIAPLTAADFVVLLPGETIQRSYTINSYYEIKGSGIFTIYAVYQNSIDPPGNSHMAWKGEIISNTVSFNINK